MSTDAANPSLRDVGYRTPILAFGALWGAAPALTFGASFLGAGSPDAAFVGLAAIVTLSLGALYELDSRALERHGSGVPLAWAYSLVVPLSYVGWAVFGPLLARLPGLELLAILLGPPASALLYVWQRGRHGEVR
ncbi:hypothetical protein ACKVMT_08425 [Halobacteriales archaeon Cl-PHB]